MADKTKKDKILEMCNSIPTKELINYICNQGVVTLGELINAGLKASKQEEIKQQMELREDEEWKKINNNAQSYRNYMEMFPQGKHYNEAKTCYEELDSKTWEDVKRNISEPKLRKYISDFPNGKFVVEANNYLEDMPWLFAIQRNTIDGYREYKSKYPGKHDYEADNAINEIEDERDWEMAINRGTSNAYRQYCQLHPYGKHIFDANSYIENNSGKESYLEALINDPNAYGARRIQIDVENNIVTWRDIENVFGIEKTEEIKNFMDSEDLPSSEPPEKLKPSTEVYFWGMPSSGKTCALGAIMSAASRKGILEPLPCKGRLYMDRLSGIFNNENYCTLPKSTDNNNLQEMMMYLRDEKGKNHKISMIDLAGELFRSVYDKVNEQLDRVTDEMKYMLDKVMYYLNDNRNPKIHFFVVEYGEENNRTDEGLRMSNYLQIMAQYLNQNNVFRKSTHGVYILVTKCDRIDCDVQERPKMAFEYVKSYLPSFYNQLDEACKKASIGDFRTLSFSLGDVFAKNLCKFDGADTDKIIDVLLNKTYPEKKGCLGSIFNFLNS